MGNSIKTPKECLQMIPERYLIQNKSYKQFKLVETYEHQMGKHSLSQKWLPRGVNWKFDSSAPIRDIELKLWG